MGNLFFSEMVYCPQSTQKLSAVDINENVMAAKIYFAAPFFSFIISARLTAWPTTLIIAATVEHTDCQSRSCK